MKPFRFLMPVRFGDVDSAGVVYYPRYGHYCHVAMEEYFQAVVGLPYPEFMRQHGLGLPAVRLETDFRKPLRYGDRVTAEVEVGRIGDSSVTWRHRFLLGDQEELAAETRVVTVCVEIATFEKKPVPGWLRIRLQGNAA
jgi:4-hydroxybenzoyl-CoA thioesterase